MILPVTVIFQLNEKNVHHYFLKFMDNNNNYGLA